MHQIFAEFFFFFWLFIFVLLLFGPILKYRKNKQPKALMSLYNRASVVCPPSESTYP